MGKHSGISYLPKSRKVQSKTAPARCQCCFKVNKCLLSDDPIAIYAAGIGTG